MRQIFQKTLESYHQVAKHGPDDQHDLETVMGWQLERGAARLKTDRATQESVYGLQEKKLEIMERLERAIADLDNPDADVEQVPGAREVVKTEEGYVYYRGADPLPVTVGEMMTDGEWNDERHGGQIKYHLNQSVERNMRKRYLIETAKRELREHLNQQIITSETASRLTDPMKKETYSRIQADQANGREVMHAGLVAEKMVRNFLKKISFDLGGDFRIIESDVYQDVVKKIDFIIHRTDSGRGVNVATGDKNHVGVQFTINPAKQEHKAEQVNRAIAKLRPEDRIDTIVLVTLRLENVMRNYRDWQKTGAAGGPDKLWSKQEKQEIFRGLMKDFLTEEEIESYCAKF